MLAALAQSPGGWTYGYDLSKRTGLKSGTIYPLLMRLCDRGLLEDSWEESPEPGRPRRHVYRLTPDGVELARQVLGPRASRGGRTAEATA